MKNVYLWLILLFCGVFFRNANAVPVTVSFQHGANGYAGARDTKLLSATPTTNYGASTKLELDGSPDIATLLYWDVTAIPAGSFVQSAALVLTVTNSTSQAYELYRLLRPWVENQATWQQYSTGVNWQVAGADGAADRGTTVLGVYAAPAEGAATITLNAAGVAVVQDWVNNPNNNQGVILLDYINTNGSDISSRENTTAANRPKLTVTYDANLQPALSINNVTVTEGNSGSLNALFTVALSPAATAVVTVNYATADGSATVANNDYVAVSGQLTFQPGQTSQPVTVVVNGDVTDESDETFFVNLSNAVNADLADSQGLATITDDDGPMLPDITVSPTSHNYGSVNVGSSASQAFVVSNVGLADLHVSATSLVGAAAGEYSITSGGGAFVVTPGNTHTVNVTFVPSSTGSKNATLRFNSDDPDASVFDVALTGIGQSTTVPGSPVTFTVTGDYPYGSSEVTLFEEHVNQHNLYSPSEFYVHVGDLFSQTLNCTAQGYETVSDMLKMLAVPAYVVIGDNDWTDCSNPTQAFQYWYQRFAFFEQNFCGAPATEHQSVRQENWAFVMNGVLFIGINNPGSTASGDNKNARLQQDADWVTSQFQSKASQIRAALVFAHSGPSSSEDLFFDPFVQASIALNKPVFFIHGHDHHFLLDKPWPEAPNMQRMIVTKGGDDDPAQITVTMDMGNPFNIVRNPWRNNPQVFNRKPCVDAGPDKTVAQNQAVQLNGAATDDGVPTNPGSLTYTWSKVSGPGTVNFGNPNSLSTSATFSSGGAYVLRLTANDGALSGSDDVNVQVTSIGPVLTINDINVTEGNAGVTNAVFTVTLSPAASQTVTVNFATADGSATIANNDYVAASGQVSFAAGETSKPITVNVNSDLVLEPNETFFVNLSGAANATITDNQGQATILDDDAPSALSINDVTVTEGNSGTVNAAFTVTLAPSSSQTVTVNYATADGSATVAGSDYNAVSGQLSFAPGETSKPVLVAVNGDELDEANETFVVNLSNAVNAVFSDNQGLGTITDDDGMAQTITVSFQDGVAGYAGTSDTKLLSATPTTNYGTANELELDGSPDVASLVSWDLTSIPSGSVVQSVTITVTISNSSTDTYEFYQLLRPWVEGQATWNVAAVGSNWQVAGADGANDRGSVALATITGIKGASVIPLNSSGVAVVQSWVDNPGANFGFIVMDYTTPRDGLDFYARERATATERPKITITFATNQVSGSAIMAAENISAIAVLPETILLKTGSPNPFNMSTRIEYSLPEETDVHLAVYNLMGRQIRLLADERQTAGLKSITWNAQDDAGQPVSSGVYVIQLNVKQNRLVIRITLIK